MTLCLLACVTDTQGPGHRSGPAEDLDLVAEDRGEISRLEALVAAITRDKQGAGAEGAPGASTGE
jgi:hypothetical protein